MQKPTFKEAFNFWLKLGFISFGGPAGQIAIMHEFLVEKSKWISDSKFLHALNFCMLLPGPEAQQLAIYIGWLLHGLRGGLVAGILFVLPSVFILLGLSIAYVMYGHIAWVGALFYGLKPAVVAIVILALIKIAKKSLSGALHYVIATLSFVLIFFLNVPFPVIIFGTIATGFLIQKFYPQVFSNSKNENHKRISDESEYFLNRNTLIENTGFSLSRLVKQIASGIILWFIPLVIFKFVSDDFLFWKNLILFFTQAAFVTFGGAYAVLPYVAQISVEKFHWLSQYQMIDGLALGETTPGPLIMVLAFVGFIAGYNHFTSLSLASVSLLTTTFYTFLPSFLFILIGAPIIETTQHNPKIKNILNIVTVAVVGVVLNLTVYFGKAVVFPQGLNISSVDYFAFAWIIISFFAMNKFKVGMIPWILISALAGLVKYFLI